jgi:apolipoprotein N-acyltransferase
MRQSMQCRASTNGFWVSMANASGYYSPYPSCFIGPDGKIINQLKQNRCGMMVNTVDLEKKFYDPMAGIRELAINGKLSSGTAGTKDKRSSERNLL